MSNAKKKIWVLGGGTITHVRNHLALCAPAYGGTAKFIKQVLDTYNLKSVYDVELVLTRMAGGRDIETNTDVEKLIDKIVEDPASKIVFMNMAFCDYQGSIGAVPSGKYAERMNTSNCGDASMKLTAAPKLISKLRKERKDIFVVGFKTTTNATEDVQYVRGLELLKKNSINLVLANDTVSRQNVIIVPEEARYFPTADREAVIERLVSMALQRSTNHFTRSTVAEGPTVPWDSPLIPDNLRKVVEWCIEKGAYKTFLGKTVGHFAVRGRWPGEIITSIRKSNFNELKKTGMVRVQANGPDKIVAYGAKPSVGGQSQRIIFDEHPQYDCIVHFHCPLSQYPNDEYFRAEFGEPSNIPVRSQQDYECGSHECGQNTSRGLMDFGSPDRGAKLAAVMLDNHGPNIVFSKDTPADYVIAFIKHNFELRAKTGGTFGFNTDHIPDGPRSIQ